MNTSGCKKCYDKNNRSIGENKIIKILYDLDITYEIEKAFPNLVNIEQLYCDFYISSLNLVIEYDGEQHFKTSRYPGNKVTRLENIKQLDYIKDKYMIENKINLLRIPYTKYNDIDTIILDVIDTLQDNHTYISYLEYIEKIRQEINIDCVNVIEMSL